MARSSIMRVTNAARHSRPVNYARDDVEGMWRISRLPEPDDFVWAAGAKPPARYLGDSQQ
jgi:GDP-D-mannose dehydratase